MTDKLTARQQAILAYIRTYQPVSSAQIAKHFGCSHSTAGVHLNVLRQAGRAWSSAYGPQSRWNADLPFAEPKNLPGVAPVSIEQVSSIWHYAERCARAA